MDTEKCKALVLAVDLKSMSAAAQAMGYTPSGVVRMINSLESELNISIIHRTNQGVTVTKEGIRVMPAIRGVVQSADTAHQLAAEIKGLNIGDLSIGSLYSISSSWLPKIIKVFSNDYPNIHIHVVQDTCYKLMDITRNNQLDCCIISYIPEDGDWINLGYDRLMALVPADSPYANFETFPLSALDGMPFINLFPNHNVNIDALLEKHNISPKILFSVEDNYSAYTMVEAGLGISINNELAIIKWQGDVKCIPLDPPTTIPIGIYLPSLRDSSPATKKFIAYAKRFQQFLKE